MFQQIKVQLMFVVFIMLRFNLFFYFSFLNKREIYKFRRGEIISVAIAINVTLSHGNEKGIRHGDALALPSFIRPKNSYVCGNIKDKKF